MSAFSVRFFLGAVPEHPVQVFGQRRWLVGPVEASFLEPLDQQTARMKASDRRELSRLQREHKNLMQHNYRSFEVTFRSVLSSFSRPNSRCREATGGRATCWSLYPTAAAMLDPFQTAHRPADVIETVVISRLGDDVGEPLGGHLPAADPAGPPASLALRLELWLHPPGST